MSYSPDFNWHTFRPSRFKISRNVEEFSLLLGEKGSTRGKNIVDNVHRRLISEDMRETKFDRSYATSFRSEVKKALITLKKSPVKLNKIISITKRDTRSGSFLEKELNEEELQVKRFIDALVSNDPSPYKKTGFSSEKQNVDITTAEKLIKEAKKIVQHGVYKKISSKGIGSSIEYFWLAHISKDTIVRWDIFEDNFLAYIKNYMSTDIGILCRLNWQKFITKFFQQVSKETSTCFIWTPSPSFKTLPNLSQKTISLQDFSKLILSKDLIFLMFSCIDETPSAPIQKQNDLVYTYACGCKYKGQWHERIREGVGQLEMCSNETYSGIFVNGKFHDFGYLHGKNLSFKGFFKKGLPNGFGKLVFPDCSRFEGLFEKGALMNGSLFFVDGSVYKGEIVGSDIEGRGELRKVDGSVWSGMWHFGKLNGEGRVRQAGRVVKGDFVDGELVSGVSKGEEFRYEGRFWGFEPDGFGEFRYKSGDRYVGSVRKGRYEGQGTLWYSDGRIYSGNFSENHPEGLGKLTYPCGKLYTGEFQRGTPHGQGHFQNFSSQITEYKGQIHEGVLEGQGEAHLSDGSIYKGQFSNNTCKGNGKLTHKSFTLEGEFLDFSLHGSGDFKCDSSYYTGIWNYGLPDGSGEAKDLKGNLYSGTFHQGRPTGKHKLSPEFVTQLMSLRIISNV